MKQTLASRNPNKRNPRKPFTEHQAIAFKKSINEFGDLSGLVWNRRTKTLIAGHKRREEFLADNPTVEITETLDKPDAVGTTAWGYVDIRGTRFSYREVDWPKSKEAAANIAANKHSADFDVDMVSTILSELPPSFDLSITGFDELITDKPALKKLNIKEPPKMAWVLIGMPIGRFGEISSAIEKIAALDGALVETTCNDYHGPEH